MCNISINIKTRHSELEAKTVANAVISLLNNLDADNIAFIGELAKKPNINATLRKNKMIIKTFV